jgi:hypothetical protein
MASVQATSCTQTSEQLRRIIIECAKYLGEPVGAEIPVAEVRSQAEANGYSDEEIEALLADGGHLVADRLTVPPQGDLFGSWPGPGTESCSEPEPATTSGGTTSAGRSVRTDDDGPAEDSDVSPAVSQFRGWLRAKADGPEHVDHSYSLRRAERKYARVYSVGEYVDASYPTYSTVLLTFCSRRQQNEGIAEHAKRFYPRPVRQKVWRVLTDQLDVEAYAGVRVLSPKPPEPESWSEDIGVTTHSHTGIWLAGEADIGDFAGVLDLHLKHVEGAVEADHPVERAVTVRTQRALDEPKQFEQQLAGEIGKNCPVIDVEYDARGLPSHQEEWCARLRLGTDNSLKNSGVSRWRPFGQFREFADKMK